MARFDIYPNPITQDRDALPYVLEVQSDLLYAFVVRVCVPLVRGGTIPGLTERFNPSILVNGEPLRTSAPKRWKTALSFQPMPLRKIRPQPSSGLHISLQIQ